MPLEHQPLTPDELQSVMRDAIRRQGAAEQTALTPDLNALSIEDALDIARQLNIPEEHVRAAIAERQRLKQRELRREAALARRNIQFVAALTVAVLCLLPAMLGLARTWLGLAAIVVAAVSALIGIRAKLAPVSDAEADRTDVAPAPGICRVCGAPAYNERATFCEAHRYKGPSPG